MRFAILALVPAIALAVDDVYQAPSPEPTPEETLILELMNRFRADPGKEAQWIIDTYGKGDTVMGADAKMFLKECQALTPKPPLVFNLQLLDSARKHSYYMVHNGLGHDEEPGKRGFTGRSPFDRMKAAGYAGGGGAENAFAGSNGPQHSHAGFIVDFGPGGTGGMQPGRGHRMNMIGNYREAGPGGVPNGKGLSVTHNLGNRGGMRLAGGVVYVDLNGNGFYDMGEGKGNVTIQASDGSRVATWGSGAYTLELKGGGAVSVKCDYHKFVHVSDYDASTDNIQFSLIIPQQIEFDTADNLLAAVTKEAEDSPNRFKAQVALAMAASDLLIDQARKDAIAAALGSVASDLQASQQRVRDAFSGDPKEMKKLLSAELKTWRSTDAATWFKEAELAWKASYAVEGYIKQAAVAKPSPTMGRDLMKTLEAARDKATVAEFASRFSALMAQIRGVNS